MNDPGVASMIEFQCESCGKPFKVPDEMAGKSGKCKQCGSAIRIPGRAASPAEEAYPVIVEVPRPSRPTPDPAPVAPASPTVNVGVSFSQPAPGKGTSGLGVAATILGILALLVCWVPLLGLVAIPLILVGGVLGLVAVIVALSGKKVGVGWPVAGVATNAAALVGVVVMSVAVAGTAAATADAMGKAIEEVRKKEAEAKAIRAAEVPTPDDVGQEAGLGFRPGDFMGGRMFKDKELSQPDFGNSLGSEAKVKILAVEGEAAQVEVTAGAHAGATTWLRRGILRVDRAAQPEVGR